MITTTTLSKKAGQVPGGLTSCEHGQPAGQEIPTNRPTRGGSRGVRRYSSSERVSACIDGWNQAAETLRPSLAARQLATGEVTASLNKADEEACAILLRSPQGDALFAGVWRDESIAWSEVTDRPLPSDGTAFAPNARAEPDGTLLALGS